MSTLTGNDVMGLMEAYQAVYAPQELDEVEFWVNSLLEEGYDLSEYTWEEMYDTYLVNEFNTIVGGLIEEGYDLSEYTEEELFDALISEKAGILKGALKFLQGNLFTGRGLPQNFRGNPGGKPRTPFVKTDPVPTRSGVQPTSPRTPASTARQSPGQLSIPGIDKGGALTVTKPNSSSLAVTKPNSSSLAVVPKSSSSLAVVPKSSSSLTAPVGSRSNPIRTPYGNVPGGPGGNKNGKKALGLGLLGLGALASMNKGGGGNEAGAPKKAPLASTTVPGKGGSPRRKEQLVGGKGNGELTATGSIVSQAKNLNKKGGVSLGSGGTGYLAQQGGKLVTVQAKGIGADDGIIGKAARKLGLTKDKDKALEAQRQNTSRANREKYLQAQGLTDPNVTGYQTKGAVRKGEKTGLNIKDSYEYDTFDTILEHLVAEGYADTEEAALVIMANMSEEWRQSIVEGMFGSLPKSTTVIPGKYGKNTVLSKKGGVEGVSDKSKPGSFTPQKGGFDKMDAERYAMQHSKQGTSSGTSGINLAGRRETSGRVK